MADTQHLKSWEDSLPSVSLNVRGTEFSFVIPNAKARWVADNVESREPEVYEWIDANLNPDSLLIDVGANFGLYSLYAAKKKDCKVISFEPHFASYYIFSRNIIVNDLSSNIALFPYAITNSPNLRTVFQLKDLSAGKALNTLANNSDLDNIINRDIKNLGSKVGSNLTQPFLQPVISTSIDTFLENYIDQSSLKLFNNVAFKIDVDGLHFWL